MRRILLPAIVLIFCSLSALAQPSTQATSVTFSSITSTTVTVNWVNGNGNKRIVVGKVTAVDAVPSTGTGYTANTVFGGAGASQLGTGNWVVYDGGGATNSVAVTGLTANTTYAFQVFEYDNAGTTYNTNTATGNPNTFTTTGTPSTQATNVTFSSLLNAGTGYTVNWTNGNGANRLVLARSGAAPNADPTNGDPGGYTANAAFTSGTQIGTGNYIVYIGTGTSVAVTGLTAGTVYGFKVYEFNGSGGSTLYNVTNGTGNPATRTTLSTEPTAASAITFSSITNTSMSVNFTNGGGASRILVAKAGSAVDFIPTDGTTYAANGNFSAAVDQGSGNKIVGLGSGAISVTGLSANTTYHFAVYEFNGSAGSENYNVTTPPANNQATAPNEPATQATNITFSSPTTSSLQVGWTVGTGANRLVVAHSGAAVDTDPSDFTSYTASATFAAGTQIGTGNYVVYSGNGNSVTVTAIASNTVYHFRVYEFDGTGTLSNYNVTTATGNPASRTTLIAEPTQASAITFSSITNSSMSVNYTNGGGSSRILVAKAGSAVDFVPTDGVSYTANNNFSAAADQGSGNKIVGVGNGAISVTGLSANTTYHFAVFEFSGSGGAENYNTTAAPVNNQITAAAEPTTQATNITFSSITSTSMQVGWTVGNGGNRIVVAKAGTVDTDPADFTSYTDNAVFGSGTQLGTGNYVVYSGSGNSVTVTGLSATTSYEFRVYEFNGSGTLSNYYTATATGNPASKSTVTTAPASQPTGMTFSSITNTTLTVNYAAAGSGTSRVLVAKSGSAVAQNPVNGTSYSATGNFSTGTDLGGGNIVVGVVTSASGGSFPITNLSANTTYHFALFEFNGSGGTESYNTTTPLTGNTTTANVPTTQATNATLSLGATPTSQLQINWTDGNGAARIVVIKDPTGTFTPANLTTYSASTDFSAGADLDGGAGVVKCIYNGTTTGRPFTVTNLSPGTQYTVQVFEYNGGAAAEQYLTTTSTGNPASKYTLSTEPTLASTVMTFSSITNTSLTVNWVATGNGANKILVVKQGGAPTAPTDGTTYTANSTVGSVTAGEITAAGSYVVYIGSGTSASVSGMTANTSYTFTLYEFNAAAATAENYLTTSTLSSSQTTRNEPANHVTGLSGTATASVITLNWTGSIGSPAPTNYLVLGKNTTNGGAYVVFSDGVAAPANDSNLGAGSGNTGVAQIAFGTNTYNGWTGLTSGSQYDFVIYPYTTGGSLTPDFKTDSSIPTVTVFTEPSASASTPTFSSQTPTSIQVTVGGATGATGGYLVLRKAGGSPASTLPSDGTSYTVGNTIAAGETIVYTGAAGSFNDTGLSSLSTYSYIVYPYSGSGTNTNYRTASPSSGSSTTLCAPPSGQASSIVFSSVTASTMTITWTQSGTSSGALVLLNDAASASAFSPSSGTSYTPNTVWSAGTDLESGGGETDAVFQATSGNSVTVTGLSASASYTARVYEYMTTGTCYNTTSPPTSTQATSAAGNTSTLATTASGASIASTATASGSKVALFSFKITDTSVGDNVPTRFSQLILRPGTGNDITDFTQLIGNSTLELTDGTNSQTANIAVAAQTITISSITNNTSSGGNQSNRLGIVDDNNNKTYTLNVWLNSTLGGSLPSTVDGMNFVLSLAAADVTIAAGATGMLSTTSCTMSSSSGVISVTATQIKILTQPSTAVNANVALSTQPIFEAADANNNRDLGVHTSNAITITTTNPTNLGPTSAPATFNLGLADFTGSGFNFTNVGSSTMAISTTSPSLTSPNTNSITVSALTTLGASVTSMSTSPLTNNTTGSISGGIATNAVLGFKLQTTGTVLNLTDLVFTSSVSVTGLVKNFKLYSNTADSFTGATQVATSSTLTFSGMSIGLSGTAKYFFLVCDVEPYFPTSLPTISFTLPAANFTVSVGNTTGSDQTGITYTLNDITPPTISSIVVAPYPGNTALNGIGSTNGSTTGTSQLTYTVTFSEPVTGVTTSPFFLTTPSFAGYGSYPNVSANIQNVSPSSSTVYTVTTNFPNNTGVIRLDFTATNAIKDTRGNSTVAGFTSGDFYTEVLDEPTQHILGINSTAISPTQIQVSWTLPGAANRSTHLLILAKGPDVSENPGAYYTPVTDGFAVPTEEVFSDGNGAAIIDLVNFPGTSSYTFSNMRSGKQYDFIIYEYNLSPNTTSDNINYLIGGNLTTSATTTTASSSSILTGTTSAITNISSLATSYGATPNFTFKIADDGLNNAADDAKTLISSLVIKSNTGNSINWAEVIQEAQLIDITENNTVLSTAITSNTITFTLATTNDKEGELDDNEVKEYELRVRLKNPLTGTSPTTIDNERFEFVVDYLSPGGTGTYGAGSSKISVGQTQNSDPTNANTNNKVTVVAMALNFVSPPPSTALVLVDVTPQAVIRAQDANGNTDEDYTSPVTISNTESIVMNGLGAGNQLTPATGVITFPASFQYADDGTGAAGNGTLTVSGPDAAGGPGGISGNPAVSGSITVSYSKATVMVNAGTGAISTANYYSGLLAYAIPYKFTITDDGGAGGDNSPTRISQIVITKKSSASPIPDWRDMLNAADPTYHGAFLYDNTGGYLNATVTINQSDITISNMLSTASDPNVLGLIGDNQSKTYQLYILFKPTLTGGLPSTVDFMNFDFEVLPGNITLSSLSSEISAAQTAINSGPLDVDVVATHLDFTPQPPADVLVNANLSTSPAVEALDDNGNRDLDYGPSSGISITNTDALIMTNAPTAFTNGLLSFPSNFQYTQIGDGTLTVSSSTLAANGSAPTSIISNAVTVRVGVAGTITAGTLTPGTISSLADLTHTPAGKQVFDFVINDDPGGTPSTEDDGNPTRIFSIRLQQGAGNAITDWSQVIQQAHIDFGGNTTFAYQYGTINATSIVFDNAGAGLPNGAGQFGEIADNGSKTFTVTIWLKQTLPVAYSTTIDGLKFVFDVSFDNIDVVLNANGSNIKAGETENSGGGNNTVAVVATQLDFTNPATTTSGSINVPFLPGGAPVKVEARDVNGNRDLNFSGADAQFTAFSTAGTLTVQNEPQLNNATDVFTNGVFLFSTNFQYLSDVAMSTNEGKINVTAGKNTLPSVSGLSPDIDIISSFESSLQLDPTFTVPSRIAYVTYQEASDIQNTSTSYELLRALLVDGSRGATYSYSGKPLNTNTDSGDGFPDTDVDGATTNLTSLTIRIYKPSTIRRIALYSNGSEISGTEINVAAIGAITSATTYYDFVWNGSPLLTAPDDGQVPLSIRVSFRSTSPELVDGDDVQIQLIAASVGTGSQFFNGNPANSGIGGPYLAGGTPSATPQSFGLINVVATSLDFVTQDPANPVYAGTLEPLGPYAAAGLPTTVAPIVHARDKFALMDLEFDYPASSITLTGGSPVSTSAFVDGVLNLDQMKYQTAGASTTLQVDAGGLSSATIPADNIGNHIAAKPVNVIHVGTALAAVTTPSNLKGGSPGQTLMGVTFTPQAATTTEPSLKKFVFSFINNPYKTATTTILKNFKVRQGATDVTTQGATVTEASSASNSNMDLVIVDYGTGSVDLFDVNTGLPSSKTFYLVADIDVTAKIGTPTMTPALIDLGYGTATDTRIVTTKGTARSALIGQDYTFASTRPPVLLTSSTSLTKPYNGQLNVDKATTQIQLEFDIPVWSLDGKAELWDRQTNVKVADLDAVTGNFTTQGTLTPTANPIKFNISFINGNSFQDDGLYYVTIKKGTFDNLANNGNGAGEGISDDGFNYFGGISSNSILFFKISSPNPPILNSAAYVFSNLSTLAFQTTFDQRGTAYYMVVPTGSVKPSNSDIDGTTTYVGTVVQRGSYPITLINSAQTTTVSFGTNLVPNTGYDIWIYAKNDANPSNIPTSGPYSQMGPSSWVENGGTTPTLKFTTPTLANVKASYQPDYSLCPDSYFTLTDPIIIGESASSDFYAALSQDFNILLPSGFEFDGVTKPTVQLIGTDFSTVATVNWVNNTIVNVRYTNNNTASLDKIIITNLRIKGTSGSDPGKIRRFAGDANLTGLINLASIANLSVTAQTFTNSYSQDNNFVPYGFAPNAVITAIPDNYIDLDASISGGIRLIPVITPANDYGVTFFTGNGVTNDVLSLGAVALNTAFDITMTHTDLNGCISENDVQYVVYDHTAPISTKLGSAPVKGSGSPLPGGTQEPLVNKAFPADAPAVIFPNTSSPRINYKDLAGYKLLSLSANIPTNAANQIILGAAWETQVNKIPVSVNQITTDTDLPSSLGFTAYNEYQWDYNHILNAVTESSSAITTNPYDNFLERTFAGNKFWRGGSLGKIQYTGTFQNTADLSVVVPFRQEVELFAPPVPLIEISTSSSADLADATVNTSDNKTPSQRFNTALYGTFPGVPVFCQQGGVIALSGFPAAVAGTSTGSFSIYDYASYNFVNDTGSPLLASAPNTAFVDNGNGTASLNPSLNHASATTLANNFKDVLVVYTFQDDNSPSVGRGYLVIRITPNPVAVLDVSGSQCVSIPTPSPVYFGGSNSNFGSATAFTNSDIDRYIYRFGDDQRATQSNPNADTVYTNAQVSHLYTATAKYNASLTVRSKYGCSSPAVTTVVGIGENPVVKFEFTGVSTADQFSFDNSLSTVSSDPSLNDAIVKLDWNFGDGSTTPSVTGAALTSPTLKTFTSPNNATTNKAYQVTLVATSRIGCTNSLTKPVIVLPRVSIVANGAYFESFETSDGNWIVAVPPNAPKNPGAPSWAHGTATSGLQGVIKNDPAINGTNVWKTNLTGDYNAKEFSAIYSPSLDISKLLRPMISFNSFVQMASGDGVIIEYSTDDFNITDSRKTWYVLGTKENEGLNWFNQNGLAGSPGQQPAGQSFGWTEANITKWQDSRHGIFNQPLSVPPSKPAIEGAAKVVFRFALGSANDIPKNGFAFDNFRIGERTRIVLLENFTNLGNDAASTVDNTKSAEDYENTNLNSFLSSSSVSAGAVVKMDYHVAFPKPDPLNQDNAQDPGARALYYGVSSTPRVRMDGQVPTPADADQVFSTWGPTYYSVRSLKLADAVLTLPNAPVFNPDGSVSFSVNVKANKDLPANTILNVAMIEKSISKASLSTTLQGIIKVTNTTYTYVVKKLLPNAAGTKFGTLLTNNASRTFGPFVSADKMTLYAPTNDLAVVVFLQDESTKEVYQTEIFDLTNDPSVVTSIEDINTAFNVYPNPADRELTIELPEVATQRSNLQMFDQVGKVVHQSAFEKGDSSKTVNTETFAGGIYIIQIETAKGLLRRKMMVLHHN